MRSLFHSTPKTHTSLDPRSIALDMRAIAIEIGGAVFHLLISGRDQNLHHTANQYVSKTGTHIVLSQKTIQSINEFKKGGKGIIFLNHSSGIISDYLPLISLLGDEVTNKTNYYTGARNKSMNKHAFPNNEFRQATLRSREDIPHIVKNIKHDIYMSDHVGGYNLVVAPGTNTNNDAPFQAIARKFIKHSPRNMPVLLNNISHDGKMGYGDILKHMVDKKGENIHIVSRLVHASDLKGKDGQEMREIFNRATVE